MIIKTTVSVDKKGNISSPVSAYRPNKVVKEITQKVLSDFVLANITKEKPYAEFNDMSLLQRQSLDQMRFNGYQFDSSSDPDDEWKSNAVRPIARNRVISITAHVTASTIYPAIFAQNDQDEEDKASSEVMRDLMEWSNDQSDYERTFLFAVIAALVNPAVVIYTEYAEVYRTIKEMQDDGTYTPKQIIDEIFSGFQDSIIPLDEIWFPDFYQRNIQKQPFIIWRRAIFYDVAQGKYGSEKNWKYVKPGIQIMYVESTGQFYEQYDENMKGELVEEIIYWNRSLDLKLCFVNGILMSDPDCPNPREDKNYPFAMTGFEPIDEGKFAFYKSCIYKMGPDEEVIQTLYRMIIDGTYLQLMPPVAVLGDEEINSSIVAPGTVTTLSEKTKIQNLGVGSNLNAGMQMLEKVEGSMNESSVDPQQSGVKAEGTMTALQSNQLQENAKVMLGLFNRMISFLVKDWGQLRVSDILQYLTLGDVMELSDSQSTVKFRSFLIPDKMVNGKKKTQKIRFNNNLPSDEHITQGEKDDRELGLLEKAGNESEIAEVNPQLFRRRKFLLRVTPDMVAPASDNLKRALNLEEYDRAIAHPLANQEAIFRDLLLGSYEVTKDDPDKYVNKQQVNLGGLIGANASAQGGQAPGNSAVAMLTNQRSQESAANVIKGGGA